MAEIKQKIRLPKLTPRQKGFVKDYIELKNGAAAARRNYNIGGKGGSKTKIQEVVTASAIASENLKKPVIQQVLAKHGLTEDYLTNKLKNNIETTEKQGYHNATLKGIELGYKLQGHLTPQEPPDNKNINIIGFITLSDMKKARKEGNIVEIDGENSANLSQE